MEHLYVGGIDEAGRGPLAGPVTAACVVLRPDYKNDSISDSKQLTAQTREVLFPEIVRNALAYSIVSVGARRIDFLNIRRATLLAMKLAAERVVAKLSERVGDRVENSIHFLVDGNAALETKLSHETIIKGDQRIFVISAASILAKVTRDQLMLVLEERYPGYGLAQHKGYGTKLHLEAIRKLGPARIHRQTFAGVKEYIISS